ncbi:MAG: NADH-quinone oxidoreductase subunit L [Anaerolineae bacterium]
MLDYAWLLLLFPLMGVLINAFFGRRIGKRAVSWVACLAVGLSFAVSLGLMATLANLSPEERRIEVPIYTWMTVGDFQVQFALLLDTLSVLMATVVTGVSLVIHIYSVGYMAEDARYARFFAYLNLFVLMMLILVVANNYLAMYVGWEGVGLCSYLLIGFWFERKAAADAGKKAFIVNRVGDFGFALGVMLIFSAFGTLQFSGVLDPEVARGVLAGSGLAGWITLLLFTGATGKSAQIPLYVWLPDAMEGPTPVSALIHAATMVTAGVYMVARNYVLFELAPSTMGLVAGIGAATAFFAATMALVHNDIKRILAYSTISQLGYMFMAVGVGAYASGMFHLTTHAFFKALLFLCAGSVMHAMHDELNIQKMGGLREKIPITYWTFAVGAAALAGVPLFSGFFSKDEILWRAFKENPAIWLVGLVTALLTAIYIFRALFVAFWGKPKDKKAWDQAHESPRIMAVPLVILALLALVGGYIGIPHLSWVEGWLEPAFHGSVAGHAAGGVTEWVLMALSALVALGGVALAYYLYVVNPKLPVKLGKDYSFIYEVLSNKYWIDELYAMVIVNPLRDLGQWIAGFFDPRVVDGAVNGVAWLTGQGGQGVSRLQSGYLRHYAVALLLGAVLVLGYFLLV